MFRMGDIITVHGKSSIRHFIVEPGLGVSDQGERGGFCLVQACHEINQHGLRIGPAAAIKLIDRVAMAQCRDEILDGSAIAEKRFVDNLRREGEILQLLEQQQNDLRSVNIIPYIHHGEMEFPNDHDRTYPAVVMARAETTLTRIITAEEGSKFYPEQCRLMTQEGFATLIHGLGTALSFMGELAHEGCDLSHRDIKAKNILLLDGRYLLADFGNHKMHSGVSKSVGCYSREVAAPELWEAIKQVNSGQDEILVPLSSADIYSAGMVCIQALLRRVPLLQHENAVLSPSYINVLTEIERKTVEDRIRNLPSRFDLADNGTLIPLQRSGRKARRQFQTDLIQLIFDMIRINPDGRPSGTEVRQRAQALKELLHGKITSAGVSETVKERVSGSRDFEPIPICRIAAASNTWLRFPTRVVGTVILLLVAGATWAAAQQSYHPRLILDTVSPLSAPAPARWSGNVRDWAKPLCSILPTPSLEKGEHIVVGVAIADRETWFLPRPFVTATVADASNFQKTAHCSAIDTSASRWQCVAITKDLSGASTMTLTIRDTRLDVPFFVRSAGSLCPVPALPAGRKS